MLTVGVDLGKRKSQFAVLEADGTILVERQLPNKRDLVRKFFQGLPKPIQVGCETCVNSYWLVDLLESIGIPIFVGHALHMKLIAHARIKTDKLDARVIARLLQSNFFPAIVIPPREVRQARELLRGRVKLSRSVAQMKNRLHGVVTRAGIDYTESNLFGPGAEVWLDSLNLGPAPTYLAKTYWYAMKDLIRRLKDLDMEIQSQVCLAEPWASIVQRLATAPGIGEFSAMLLALELWDIKRFPDPKHLASYIGMVPSVHQTGQTLRGGSITKQGNRYVRWILVQDAWAAIRSCSRYRGLYEHYARRQGRTRAVIPVARQLLTDVYDMWRQGITYEELIQKKLAESKRA